jgi:hypothetical protein
MHMIHICFKIHTLYHYTLEACKGPGLASQIMFGSKPGSGFVQIMAIKRYIKHFGLYPAIRSSPKKKTICSCAHLMLVTESGSGYKSHSLDFLGDFRSCHISETDKQQHLTKLVSDSFVPFLESQNNLRRSSSVIKYVMQ